MLSWRRETACRWSPRRTGPAAFPSRASPATTGGWCSGSGRWRGGCCATPRPTQSCPASAHPVSHCEPHCVQDIHTGKSSLCSGRGRWRGGCCATPRLMQSSPASAPQVIRGHSTAEHRNEMFVWRPRALAWRLLHYAELDAELSGVGPSGGWRRLPSLACTFCLPGPPTRHCAVPSAAGVAGATPRRARYCLVVARPLCEGQQQLLQLGSRLAGRAGSARSLAPVPAAAAKSGGGGADAKALRLCDCDHEMYVPLRRLARRCHRGGV